MRHTNAIKNQKAILLPRYILSAGEGRRFKLNIFRVLMFLALNKFD
tara:strand:+ start:425 stop:562 length:138 start_codon:yes stop_codon:yes gene_type:complete